MGNCLKTQLKEQVTNPELAKMGDLRLTGNFKYLNFIISSEACTISLAIADPDVRIKKQDNTEDTSFEVPANTTFYFYVTGDKVSTINITKKYSLTALRVDGVTMTPVPFSDIKYITGLTQISSAVNGTYSDIGTLSELVYLGGSTSATGGDVTGISSLKKLTTLEMFYSSIDITGSITSFGEMTALLNLTLANTKISGRLEDFVVAQRNATTPRHTCVALTTKYLKDNANLRFGDAAISEGGTVTLSWAPNASDSTKTDITFGNASETIDASGNIVS